MRLRRLFVRTTVMSLALTLVFGGAAFAQNPAPPSPQPTPAPSPAPSPSPSPSPEPSIFDTPGAEIFDQPQPLNLGAGTPSPSPSPTPPDGPFKSPLTGDLGGPAEASQFSSLVDAYHAMIQAQINLAAAQACQSGIAEAMKALTEATSNFDIRMQGYIRSFSEYNGAGQDGPGEGRIILGRYNQMDAMYGPTGYPKSPEQQKTYESAVGQVTAAVVKADKKPYTAGSCPATPAAKGPSLKHPVPPPPGGGAPPASAPHNIPGDAPRTPAEALPCWVDQGAKALVQPVFLVPEGSASPDLFNSETPHAGIPGGATFTRGTDGSWTNDASGAPVPNSSLVPNGSQPDPLFPGNGDRRFSHGFTAEPAAVTKLVRIPCPPPAQDAAQGPNPPKPQPPPPVNGGQLVSTLVGIIVPADTRPGDQISATVVTSPQAYDGVPGLRVVQVTLPLAKDAQGTATLSGLVVETGDKKPQSAERPLLVQVAKDAQKVDFALQRLGEDNPRSGVAEAAKNAVSYPIMARDVGSSIPASSGKASDYTTPPVYSDGALQVIHGPVSGDSKATQVLVDNQPGKIVAESPRALYFKLPDNTAPGAHTVTLKEGAQPLTSFHVAVVSLKLSADQLVLKRGQSTAFHATILGADSLPPSAWHAGVESDLIDPKEVAALAPAGALKAEKPGLIAMKIENKSKDTVQLTDAKGNQITNLLGKESFAGGPYTFDGKLKSVRDGNFNIDVRVVPLLAPIAGELAEAATNPSSASEPEEAGPLSEPVAGAPPPFTTPEELPHLVAYFTAATGTLHVRDAEHFSQRITEGKFPVQWKPGESSAQVLGDDGGKASAPVALDKASDAPPAKPEIGDVKYLDESAILKVDQDPGGCGFYIANGNKWGLREVRRHYTYLGGTGDESGTETFSAVHRDYYYRNMNDCTGLAGVKDGPGTWTLTVGSWPKP